MLLKERHHIRSFEWNRFKRNSFRKENAPGTPSYPAIELSKGVESILVEMYSLFASFDSRNLIPVLLIPYRKADQACRNFARGSTYIAQHIIEGKEADEGEIPFIAALGYSSLDPAKEYDFRCGASWIAKKFLLTAAHCVRKNDRPVVARIGTINLDETDRTRFQDSEVKVWLLLRTLRRQPIDPTFFNFRKFIYIRSTHRKVNITTSL